ncbi:unnamed protein product [Ophioblennius macclurei]
MDARAAAQVLPRVLLLLASLRAPAVRGDGYLLVPVELAPVPCNDKAVEKLSRLAATFINEDRTDGYKFALNRVSNVHLHAQGPAGNVYYLDLDVLETKCHTGSPKPWKRCDVRPFMETQVSGNCNTTILHTPEGYSYLYSYDCALVPDPPEKLQQTCPTCPTLLSVDAPEAATAAQLALESFRRRSGLAAGLGVKKITRAAVKTRPGKAHFVEFTVQQCPEGITHRGTCHRLTLKSDTETAGFCTGSVYGRLDLNADAQVSCEMFKTQNVDAVRPVLRQAHDFPLPREDPYVPTFAPRIDDTPQPAPSDPPPPPPEAHPAPYDPAPVDPVPLDPAVAARPPSFGSSSSSSSESVETLVVQQPPPPSYAAAAGLVDSSSEEVAGLVAVRPPFGSFRYPRRDRKRRQALAETSPSYVPVFLSDFPSGASPFRSCPGPARYTTV